MNNKRIGIITFHRTSNFGSALQAYALYYAIKKLGYSCDFIDYRCPAIEKREYIEKKIITSLKDVIFNIIWFPFYKKKFDNLNTFLKINASFSDVYTPKNIKNVNDLYDIFLVGSDIVWGRDITENDYTYFLDFLSDYKTRLAFSSSVGSYGIRGDENRILPLLKKFNYISVREKDAIGWLYDLGINNVKLTCDPTMLLTCEEWNFIINSKVYKEDYVLLYFLDDNKKAYFDAIEYARIHKMKVYYIYYGFPKKGVRNIKPTTLEEFIGLIKYAKMIFTASYHGMLFSIYFRKQFVFYTRAHKSRVVSLAEKLKVDMNCADEMDISSIPFISYETINPLVEEFRNYSLTELSKNLDLYIREI